MTDSFNLSYYEFYKCVKNILAGRKEYGTIEFGNVETLNHIEKLVKEYDPQKQQKKREMK